MRYAEAEAVNFLKKFFIFNWQPGNQPATGNLKIFFYIFTAFELATKNSFTKIMDIGLMRKMLTNKFVSKLVILQDFVSITAYLFTKPFDSIHICINLDILI